MSEIFSSAFIQENQKGKRKGKRNGQRFLYQGKYIYMDEIRELVGCSQSTAHKYLVHYNFSVEAFKVRYEMLKKKRISHNKINWSADDDE